MKIRLENFKSIEELNDFNIKPLTLLCGPNSSGKSSILQSILLQKQSFIPRRTDLLSTQILQPFLFKGSYVKLGNLTDVIFQKNKERALSFAWKIYKSDIPPYLIGRIEDETRFSFRDSFSLRRARSHLPFLLDESFSETTTHFELRTSVQYARDQDDLPIEDYICFKLVFTEYPSNIGFSYKFPYEKPMVVTFSRNLLVISYIRALRAILHSYIERGSRKNLHNYRKLYLFLGRQQDEIFDDTRRIELQSTGFGGQWSFVDLLIFEGKHARKAKKEFFDPYIHLFEDFESILKEFNLKSFPIMRDVLVFPFSDAIWRIYTRFRRKEDQKYLEIPIGQIFSYNIFREFLINFLENIRYLGPLRDEPKRYYPFTDIAGIDIGVKGEYTAQILSIQKNNLISEYYALKDEGQIFSFIRKKEETLLSALNYWFDFMGLGKLEPIIYREPSELYRVNIEQESYKFPISDVGFGISQFLPVALEALRMNPGETLILEQPEIHLHPRLQSKLADFLISMAKSRRNFILESHSEYLIKRVALRIAQDSDDEIRDLINIQFIDIKENRSNAIPININEYGEIETWPIGFLDDKDSLSLIESNLRKRSGG